MRNKAYGVRGVGEDNSDLGRRRRFCGKQRKNGLNFKLKYGLPNLSLKGKAKTRAFHFSFEGKLGPSTFPQRRERGAYFYAYLRIRLKRKRKIRKKVPMSLVLSFPQKGLCRELGLVPFLCPRDHYQPGLYRTPRERGKGQLSGLIGGKRKIIRKKGFFLFL